MIDGLTLYKSIYMLVVKLNTRYSKIITFLYYFQQLDSIVSSEVEHLSLISSHKRNIKCMYVYFPISIIPFVRNKDQCSVKVRQLNLNAHLILSR